MLHSTAKAFVGSALTRRASNRHRKQGRDRMGKFAEAASQHDVDKRGDGYCVAGRWISENLDEEDLVELVRLANGHKWDLIARLTGEALRRASLDRHVHGLCPCFEGTAARGCCGCHKTAGAS